MALADAAGRRTTTSSSAWASSSDRAASDLQTHDLAAALQGDTEPALRCATSPYFAERILAGLNPLWLLISLPEHVERARGHSAPRARDRTATIMTDWAAGSQAIGEASDGFAWGEADAVLAGGTDSGLNPFVYTDYQSAGLFEATAADGVPGASSCRPKGPPSCCSRSASTRADRGAAIRGEVCAYASGSGADRGRRRARRDDARGDGRCGVDGGRGRGGQHRVGVRLADRTRASNEAPWRLSRRA